MGPSDPNRPPALICPLCEFDVDHRHLDGAIPIVECRPCFVGLHVYCDPATYWCACSHADCLPRGD